VRGLSPQASQHQSRKEKRVSMAGCTPSLHYFQFDAQRRLHKHYISFHMSGPPDASFLRIANCRNFGDTGYRPATMWGTWRPLCRHMYRCQGTVNVTTDWPCESNKLRRERNLGWWERRQFLCIPQSIRHIVHTAECICIHFICTTTAHSDTKHWEHNMLQTGTSQKSQ